jgi:hypothetical protein
LVNFGSFKINKYCTGTDSFVLQKKFYYCFKNGVFLSFAPFFPVLRSRSRKEPHLLVGARAGAVTQCGSGSDGSGSDNGIKLG